jgi:hypothetical protein
MYSEAECFFLGAQNVPGILWIDEAHLIWDWGLFTVTPYIGSLEKKQFHLKKDIDPSIANVLLHTTMEFEFSLVSGRFLVRTTTRTVPGSVWLDSHDIGCIGLGAVHKQCHHHA